METENKVMDNLIELMPKNRSMCENPPYVIRGSYSQTIGALSNSASEIKPLPSVSNLSQSVGVHWFRCTLPAENCGLVLKNLAVFFGGYEKRLFGRDFFDRHYHFDSGVSVLYNSKIDSTVESVRGLICVDISGGAFDGLNPSEQYTVLRILSEFKAKPSRIDIFYNDFERIISPFELAKTVSEVDELTDLELKRDFCGFRTIDARFPVGKNHNGKRGLTGSMVSFGRRGSMGSGKYLRIYDKNLESKGEINCVRYELELSKNKAVWLYNCLLSTKGNLQALALRISATIAGCIDFRKKSTMPAETNLGRIPRYEWWEKILEKLIACDKIQITRPEAKIEKSIEWVKNSVIPSLQTIREAQGDENFFTWFIDTIAGTDRLQPRHRKMIQDFKRLVNSELASLHDAREYFAENGVEL